jgi:hypothetical protein
VKVTKDFTDIIKMIVYKSPNCLSAVVPVVGLICAYKAIALAPRAKRSKHPEANIQIDTLTGQESHYLMMRSRTPPMRIALKARQEQGQGKYHLSAPSPSTALLVRGCCRCWDAPVGEVGSWSYRVPDAPVEEDGRGAIACRMPRWKRVVPKIRS